MKKLSAKVELLRKMNVYKVFISVIIIFTRLKNTSKAL